MNRRFTTYCLALLLGGLLQATVCFADDCEVTYNAYTGRWDASHAFSFTEENDAYFSVGLFPEHGLPRPALNLRQYTLVSGGDGTAGGVRFFYVVPKENPYLIIHYAVSGHIGYGGHEALYDCVRVMAGGSMIGCPFEFTSGASAEEDIAKGYIITSTSSVFFDGYFPWRVLVYNLSDYIGQTITIEGIAACCDNVKCKSTLYLAFENFGPQELCTNCGVTKISVPSGLSSYIWHKGSPNGPIVSKEETIYVDWKHIDDYYCTIYPPYCEGTPFLMTKRVKAVASFDYRVACGEEKDTLYLTNNSYMYYDDNPSVQIPCDTVFWDFGDGRSTSDFSPGPITFDHNGIYDVSLQVGNTDFICDSTQYIRFETGNVSHDDKIDTICESQLPYIWREKEYTASGDYYDTLTNKWGCDSLLHLSLLIYPTTYSYSAFTINKGESVLWQGQTYTEAGTYTKTLVNMYGCDSILTLTLTLKEPKSSDTYLTICPGHLPYTWNGVLCLGAGDYSVTLQTALGQDSVARLHLVVGSPAQTDTAAIVCIKDFPFLWHGQLIVNGGVYKDTLPTTAGCDSVITFKVTEKDCSKTDSTGRPIDPMPFIPVRDSLDTTICIGDTLIWHDVPYWRDTIVRDTGYYSWYPLDSVYWVLNLHTEECSCDTMRDTTDITLPYDTLKAKGGYMWFGQMRDSAGVYRDTIETVEGCDSIGLLILRVAYERDTIVCGDDTAVFKTPWGEIGLDSCECKEGWIRKTADNEGLVWAKLCVTRLYADTVREDTTLCYGTSIVWHGITIDQTKEYEYHEPFTRLMTCDSVVYYLDATIKPEPQPHKTIDAVCAGETYIWTTYRDSIIEGPGTYYDTLWTDHGCYSDYYELELTHKALSIGANDTTVCGLPVVWEDSTWYESGVKTKILKNAVGCDSVVTLTLYVNEPTDQKDQDTIVCYGETIFWRNRLWKDLTKDSTLRDTLKYNGSPCDSIRYERLVRVRAQVKDSVSCEYACYGADVEWRGQKVMNITATQILTDMVAYKGTTCDSIHFEHTILVQKADTLPEYKTICYGQTYHWKRNGKQDSIVSTSGIYKDTVRYAATGCDSAIYVLDLKVDAINKDSVNQTTCQGTPYLWRGKELTIDSIYRDTATAKTSAECDTVYILKLTVNPILYGTPEEQTICEGDSILWSGKYYKEAGTYKDTMASVITGCDSIISLVLSTKKCCPDTIHRPTTVNMCDTLLPYTWHTYRDILVDRDTLLTDTLRTERGCDSIIYILNLTTYHCCRPNMAATMEVMDVCADATVMDVIVDLSSGEFDRYRVHYDNAPGNKMPFRDTMITLPTYYGQTEHILLNPPVPHDAIDRTNYPRPDEYAMTITFYNACGDSLNLGKQTFDVRYPSWILDQHWDDVIAILNDRYNGGYTFSRVEWLRDDEILAGEDELYIYLPHQLWTSPQGQYHDYYYQARLTRADDGKTMITCPMVPHHIDSTNVLTEPYVAVTPTLVHQENPIVYVQTNTKGTYWVYDTTGKLLQTADYEPTDHNVFDIQLYNVQTMYILVFTPREETKPLQDKYRVVKVLVE